MPAEWEAHEATWLAWPHNENTWPEGRLAKVRSVYVTMIESLLRGEKVHLLVNGNTEAEQVRSLLGEKNAGSEKLTLHFVPTADVWIRDYGPTFLCTEARKRAWCKWIFNAWGGKYKNLVRDTEVFLPKNRERLESVFMQPVFEADFVLEGGSIEVNGRGTCLTTRQCLLNPNRNPKMSQEMIEDRLRQYLGVSDILWLDEGIAGDDTDGHVDDIARFVSADTILAAYEDNPEDINYPMLKKNWGLLEKISQRAGAKFHLRRLPMPPAVENDGDRLPASYANFYIANAVVLVPVFDVPSDADALALLKELFPDRKIIGLPSRELVYGLGAIHCVTQQQPR
ncbi:MAG: agmatine deiminase family protein [Candidatus Omnitrophota bacterium]|nr:agmatine deiminase family protein [Candidatus Omnitrophota bacterium]